VHFRKAHTSTHTNGLRLPVKHHLDPTFPGFTHHRSAQLLSHHKWRCLPLEVLVKTTSMVSMSDSKQHINLHGRIALFRWFLLRQSTQGQRQAIIQCIYDCVGCRSRRLLSAKVRSHGKCQRPDLLIFRLWQSLLRKSSRKVTASSLESIRQRQPYRLSKNGSRKEALLAGD